MERKQKDKEENTTIGWRLKDTIDVGLSVVCDLCGEDFTNRDDVGGFLLGSNAVCPKCAPTVRADLVKYNELRFVKRSCPDGVPFREWVLRLRGGDNTIKFYEEA